MFILCHIQNYQDGVSGHNASGLKITLPLEGSEFMLNSWITLAILSALALIANVAVCLYTLYLAKKSENRFLTEGYIKGFIDFEANTNELLASQLQKQESSE